jgi:antirestriction protein ArdC
LIHELTHWTGHSSRCDRDLSGRFGTQKYAYEELIAELGAAFTCNTLGISSAIENHASYLDNWLAVLKGDNKAFLRASSAATKASMFC